MKGTVALGHSGQEAIRHEVGSEVMPDSDRVLRDYAIAKYLLTRQGLVQKWILNNFSTKYAGLCSELTQLFKPLTESPM